MHTEDDESDIARAEGFSRRQVIAQTGVGAASLLAAAALPSPAGAAGAPLSAPEAVKGALPATKPNSVEVPNGVKLPWKKVAGAKVYHLVAEEVDHEFLPGLKAKCWGYNGRVHGPVIEAVEGDRVRIYVTNKLGAPTTVHWHGLLLPNGMDGVGGLTQKAILPGETFRYEFDLKQHGTYMYHSHHDEMTQMAMGMTGLFVVHPKAPQSKVDRDFAIMLHEWALHPGASRPDPNEMSDFNLLTMNGKAFPGTAPLVIERGQKVRIRFGNLSAMDHHPIHLHGHVFWITETDGGVIPKSARWPETTVLVATGSTRTIEFVADAPGDWPMHCHMTHHVMNQMGHGLPNIIGIEHSALDAKAMPLLPGYMTMGQTGMGEMAHMQHMPMPENSAAMVMAQGKHDVITMGGMFTVVKIREGLKNYEDPGWYEMPKGTLATNATAAELKRDGIVIG